MALILSKRTASGVTGNYWRIIRDDFDYDRGVVEVCLCLYLNSSARTEGCDIIYRENFIFSTTGIDHAQDHRTWEYHQIKATTMFASAVSI